MHKTLGRIRDRKVLDLKYLLQKDAMLTHVIKTLDGCLSKMISTIDFSSILTYLDIANLEILFFLTLSH